MTDLSEIHSAIVALGPREFAARLGFNIDRRGRGRCPAHGGHNDEQFSLSVKEGRTVVYHCFNCGESGDALDLIGLLRGRSDFGGKVEAAAELLNAAPTLSAAEPFEPEPERIDPISYHNVVTELRAICLKYKPIRDVCLYLQRRKLLDLASEFGLFALPPRAQQREVIRELGKQFALESLVRAGLLYQSREGVIATAALLWADARLCISWLNTDGKVDALQRRVVHNVDGPRYVFPRSIRPMHPYGAAQLKAVPKDHPIAFCEGALDAIALTAICRREGYSIIALGLPGVDGWRDSWGELVRGREVYIALDNDKAGNEAFIDLAPKLHVAGASALHWWRPDNGKDWGDELIGIAS